MAVHQDPFFCKEALTQADIQIKKAKNVKLILEHFLTTKAIGLSLKENTRKSRCEAFLEAIGRLKETDSLFKELTKLNERAFSFVAVSHNGRTNWDDLLAMQVNGFLEAQMIPTEFLDKMANSVMALLRKKKEPEIAVKIIQAVSNNSATNQSTRDETVGTTQERASGNQGSEVRYMEPGPRLEAIQSRQKKRARTNEPTQHPVSTHNPVSLTLAHHQVDQFLTPNGVNVLYKSWTWDNCDRTSNWRALLYNEYVTFIIEDAVIADEIVGPDDETLFRREAWGSMTLRQQAIRRWIIQTPRKKGQEIVNQIYFD